MIFTIVENPNTKELFMNTAATYFSTKPSVHGKQVSLMDFSGDTYGHSLEDVKSWKVLSKVSCASAWRKNPGDYRTFNAVMSISYWDVTSSKQVTFKIGENLAYINNYVKDTKKNHPGLVTLNERAYSCRNTAIGYSDCH